ncbi:EAL domain-containing protein [Micromonospora sp. NPDC049048]|uniref:EAL domain-containing protein n=1 Tax=Micromonospora sp. NPDC049048 TaxID=3364263 RepID=UPI00371A5C17
MPLAYPQRASIPRPARPDTLVLAAVALLLLAGAAGRLPVLAVVALAGAASCALAGTRLSRLIAAPPAPAQVPARSRAARRRAAPHRRVAVLLDAAVVTAGLTAAVLPLAAAGHRRAVVVSGLAVAAALFVAGLPPTTLRPRPAARARLRAAVDATVAGLGLVLAGWLLLPREGLDPPLRLAVAVALGGLALAVLVVSTGPLRRTGAAHCRTGAALTLSGLVVLAAFPAGGTPDRAALLAVPPLVGGVLLTAAGARRATRAEPAPPDPPTRVCPRIVIPAVAAVAGTGWQLRHGGPPDLTAVLLGLALAPPLVLRELLRADDGFGSLRAEDPPARHRSTDPERSGEPADRPALLRALAARRDAPAPAGALLVVDLHGAGPVADGHRAREDVLAEAVRRARAVVGPRDLVADVTATGFAVVTEVGPVLAYALGIRLLAALNGTYEVAGGALWLRAGVGLAEIGDGGPEEVLRQADLARRRAVQLGRDRVEWYDAYLEEQLVRRLDLERELPGAVARGELDLVYQPVLDLADRQPVGTEALLRWRSPVLGTVLPAEFLPVAEDLGIVGELGCWVLDRACRQLAAWSGGSRQLWMAVNVTVRELAAPDFVPRTAAVLDAYGLSPDRLVVEVAEPRVGAELPTVVARLAGLRSLGVRTALDDFRAEHASLAQLRRLPIDLLKVGPQLVDPADPQRPLIDVVVNVGDRLGLDIVAEELESASLVDGARRAGCRYGQGFALARPATAERVEAYFEEFPSASR